MSNIHGHTIKAIIDTLEATIYSIADRARAGENCDNPRDSGYFTILDTHDPLGPTLLMLYCVGVCKQVSSGLTKDFSETTAILIASQPHLLCGASSNPELSAFAIKIPNAHIVLAFSGLSVEDCRDCLIATAYKLKWIDKKQIGILTGNRWSETLSSLLLSSFF